MNAELRKEIENVSFNAKWSSPNKYTDNIHESIQSLVKIVEILSSEIDRLEQEKISHEKH